MAYVFLFIQQIFEYLLCVRDSVRCQGYSNEQDGHNLCMTFWLEEGMGQTVYKQIQNISGVSIKCIEEIGEERSVVEYV